MQLHIGPLVPRSFWAAAKCEELWLYVFWKSLFWSKCYWSNSCNIFILHYFWRVTNSCRYTWINKRRQLANNTSEITIFFTHKMTLQKEYESWGMCWYWQTVLGSWVPSKNMLQEMCSNFPCELLDRLSNDKEQIDDGKRDTNNWTTRFTLLSLG